MTKPPPPTDLQLNMLKMSQMMGIGETPKPSYSVAGGAAQAAAAELSSLTCHSLDKALQT